MSRHAGSLPAAYFERLYAADPDPWKFATSDYEREKYAATLAALPRELYGRALDVGCSIGVLTRALAERCRELVAMDPVPSALAAARERCADTPQVAFLEGAVPAIWPPGRFDLVLLSEVVYYLDQFDLSRLVGLVAGAIEPQADIVMVHWTGETDYPLGGDEAAGLFIAGLTATGVARVDPGRSSRSGQYRLDVLRAA